MGIIRRWPPLTWLGIAIGSVFMSMGMQRHWLLAVGGVVVIGSFACALYLAVRPEPGHPGARPYAVVLIGVAAFYILCAIAAGATVGWAYALVALLAGAIPGTAAALTVATSRRKTGVTDEGVVDLSQEDRSEFPGLGLDAERPLGDTPDAHDEIIPEDLPKDHPGRRAAEEMFEEQHGGIRGHAEGGASAPDGPSEDRQGRLGERERGGARARRS